MSSMGSFSSKFENLSVQPGPTTERAPATSVRQKRKLDDASEGSVDEENGDVIVVAKHDPASPAKRSRPAAMGLDATLRKKDPRLLLAISSPINLNANLGELASFDEDHSEPESPSSRVEEDSVTDSSSEGHASEEAGDDGSQISMPSADEDESAAEEDEESMELDQAEEPVDDSIVVEDTKKYHTALTAADLAAAKQLREAETANLHQSGWYPSELALFHKLSMRGIEPLLPKDWEFDFPSIPRSLFTYNLSEAFIKPYGYPYTNSASFRAKKLLQGAMETGPLVRLAIRGGNPGERWLNKLMRSALRWIYDDTGLRKRSGWLPVLHVVKGSRNSDPGILQNLLVKHLERLEVAWKQKLNGKKVHDGPHLVSIPQLYGVIITSSVLALVSYVPSERPLNADANFFGNKSLRLQGLFNFAKTTHDVWSAFAVVILMVHCRDVLMSALNEAGLMETLGWAEESDPDA